MGYASTFNPYRSKKTICISVILCSLFVISIIVASLQLLPSSLQLPVAFAQQISFNDPVPLDDSPGQQADSHIASSGSTAYMTWTSETSDGVISKIMFAKTSDGGITFDSRKTLSDDSGAHFALFSDIAVSGDNVYVVWTDVTNSESDILFIKSTDGGDSFTQPIKLNDGNPPDGSRPRIAVSGSNVYVVWVDRACCPNVSDLDSDIYVAVSTNDGATFSSPINVYNNPETGSFVPSIAASGANVYIAWRDDADFNPGNSKIFYVKSSNAGSSFSSPVTLANPMSSNPDIKVSGNNVYVVYSQRTFDGTTDVRNVFLVKSSDGGNNFGSPILLRTSSDPQGNIRMDVDQDILAITWQARIQDSVQVLFIGSTNAGNTFTEPISLSDSLSGLQSSLSDVTISGQNVYIDWTSGTLPESDIYFDAGTITPSVSPVEGIGNLIDTIDNMNLIKSVKTSLEGPLHNAIKLLTDSDPTNDKDVCDKLNSFIEQVNSKENNERLTSQQAADLRAQATAIGSNLACTSASQVVSSPSQSDDSRGMIVLPY